MHKMKPSLPALAGSKSGEVRINGMHVFINDTEVSSLRSRPPVLHTPRLAGGVAPGLSATKHPVKPGQAAHHARKPHSAKPHRSHVTGHAMLAPGAANAIQAALGKDGLRRVGRIVTPGQDSLSGGTHRASGYFLSKDGKKRPYGCAFDVRVAGETPTQAQQDARDLRLQGIAAWYRAPGSESGLAGSGPHIHCVWPGAPTSNVQNLQQISSFVQGYKGLANHLNPKNAWIDSSIQADEIKAVEAAYDQGGHSEPLSQVPSYDDVHTSPRSLKRKRKK